jgi:hypothetical protein
VTPNTVSGGSPVAAIDPLGERLTVVVFVLQSGRSRDSVPQKGALSSVRAHAGEESHRRWHEGERLLPMLAASVRRIYPRARFVILTDPETSLPAIPPPVEVRRCASGRTPLMYERLQLYADYLRSARGEGAHLFLDSDTLMVAPFRAPIGERFDVAVTFNNRKGKWLLNGGLILVAAGRQEPAQAYVEHALRIYKSRYLADPRWSSDQSALFDALELGEWRALPTVIEARGFRALLLPADRFNYSPPIEWRSVLASGESQFVLHFKGALKPLMPWYFRLHIDPGVSSLTRSMLRAAAYGRSLGGVIRRRISCA